ncbi:MAG TPA: hypothetical protein VHH73_18935 [Verrucomicrobiae bacterium]|nr:hypothetical protein [Verrucomicrobiae bacterium]
MSALRPSSEIEMQLEAFLAALPAGVTAPPANDFAASLQWSSWQNHRQELERELEAARLEELADADLQIAFSGDPVFEHDIKAGFLGGFLSKAQSLINALAQVAEQKPTERGSIANSVVEDYRLLVAGTFPSSFGLRLRLHSAVELGHLRLSQTDAVLDQFCSLIDPNLAQTELIKAMASPRVKTHYYDLVGVLGKEGAQITVRTKARLKGVRINAQQARDRSIWMDSLTESATTLSLVGILTGGSIATNRFELEVNEEFYRGRISPEARAQMKDLKLGERVKAEIIETTFSVAEASVEGHATYFLKSVVLVQPVTEIDLSD